MKQKTKKIIFYVFLLILVMNIAGCTTSKNVSNKDKHDNSPNIEEVMIEELPNGQVNIINESSRIDEEISEWIYDKKVTLTSLIAEQTNLEINKVNVMVSPMDNTENLSRINIACTIVLNTDSTFDDLTINNLVESITTNISSQSAINAYISKDNIVISNKNNIILY